MKIYDFCNKVTFNDYLSLLRSNLHQYSYIFYLSANTNSKKNFVEQTCL